MATRGHFAKFQGLKTTSKHAQLNQSYMEKMIVRQPQLNEKNLHPKAKARHNMMIQEPLPLSYKLHEWPTPEVQTKLDALKAMHEAKMVASGGDPADVRLPMNSMFVPLNNPLGTLEALPFEVERSAKGNLPVYTDFRAGG